MTIRKVLAALIISGLVASPAAFGQAQGQQGQQGQQQEAQPMPQQQQEAPDVSDEQIEQFVDAYINLSDVREDYTTRVQEAEDQEEAQAIQEEANEAMTAAIEDAGLSMEEYQEVAMAINADSEIRERVTSMLEERDAL